MRITGAEKGGNMKNKKIKNIFVCMLVCATLMVVAGTSIAKTTTQQSSDPEMEWIHIFDSIIDDRAYYVDQTTDGGYIFTGSTIVPPNGYTQLLLAKTDKNGEESWLNHFPMSGTNLYGTVVHQTTDGGYIIVGSVGYTYLWDVHVVKADANGDLVWQKSFGLSDQTDHGSDILQTSDGGYLVLGSTSSYGQGQVDLWLIKLAADGTEQWNTTIGGVTYDNPNKFAKADDGGYIIVGSTDAVESAGDIWVVKTNDAGEVSWQKTFGNADITEDAVDVITESNGYTILGSSYDANFTESIWILHLDAQGTLTSDQHIYGNGTLHGTSISPTTDGGYFITGSLYDMVTYVSDIYLLKLNHQGATQWVKTIDLSEGSSDETGRGLQARDGGYVVIGNAVDPVNRTSDTFILKIEAETNVVLDSVTGPLGVQAHIKNLGTTEATGVNVLIKITGGIFHRINISYMETISIPAGEETTVACKPFLGLGSINISVAVNGVTSDFEAKQFIILTLLQS
jgi:hypothetical protein